MTQNIFTQMRERGVEGCSMMEGTVAQWVGVW